MSTCNTKFTAITKVPIEKLLYPISESFHISLPFDQIIPNFAYTIIETIKSANPKNL